MSPGAEQTLPARLARHAAERPGAVALREKRRGRWQETTWAQYAQRVERAAGGLRALGVGPGDTVALLASDRAEWAVADLAAQALGAVPAAVDPDADPAAVQAALAGAVVAVAEDEEQLDKVLAVRAGLGELRRIVVADPRGVRFADDEETVLGWAALEAGGEPLDLAAAAAGLAPGAPPAGGGDLHTLLGAVADDEVLSTLPPSDPGERALSLVGAVTTGYVVNFGAGGESFRQDVREVQPTLFVAPARAWEAIHAATEERMRDATRLKRGVHGWCLRHGVRAGHRALREKLGLSRVRAALCTEGALTPAAREFYAAIGVPVREAREGPPA